MFAQQPICAPLRWRSLALAFTALGLFVFMVAPARADTTVSPLVTIGTQDPNLASPPDGLTLEAVGEQTGSFSSNPLLAIGKTKSLIGSTTSPEMLLQDTSPTGLLSLDTRMDENIFNQSNFNSTDIHATTGTSTQNERWAITLPQHIDYDTTRTSELSNFNLGVNITRHFGYLTSPQITYAPTADDSLAVAGSVATSEYANDVFTDYHTYSITPSYTHHVDPLNAAILSLQAQRYATTDNVPAHVDSIGPTVGWSTTFSPRFSANAAIGAQTTQTTQAGIQTPWQWQYIFSSGLTFTGQQDIINLSANRGQTAYGNGTDALQANYAFTESHALNKLFALNFGGNYTSSTYQSIIPGSQKSYLSGTTGLTYHATEHVDFIASYTYRYQNLVDEDDSAHDNAVMLNAVYHPKLWTLFR